MRTIIVVTVLSLSLAACINSNKPMSESSKDIHPEALGVPNSEQQGGSFAISTKAFYQASVNSSTTPGKVISLSLTPEHKAEMTTNFLDNGQVMVDTGIWSTLNSGNLHLNLRRTGEKDSIQLEFKTDGEKLVYTGTEYGAAGLILWVKPVPE